MKNRLAASRVSWIVLLASLQGPVAACGGSTGDPAVIDFQAQQDAFPGLMQDTGYQPADSPVQLRLAVTAMGGDTLDARATAGGTSDAPTLTGNRQGGQLALDVHVGMHATIKIDFTVLGRAFRYEGPLRNVPDLDLHGTASATFDPFLLDGTVPVDAMVPEAPLPPIDLMLATGIPGTLHLFVGGTVHSEFGGTCAAIDSDGTAQYLGRVSTSAMVNVRAQVEISVPGFSRTLPSIMVPVDIPAVARDIDLGTHRVTARAPVVDAGGSMAQPGRCGAVSDAGTTVDASDGDTGVPMCSSASRGCTDSLACCAGLTCVSGSCRAPVACGPSNCNGCCTSAGVCVAGSASSACGTGGAQCSACASGTTCSASRCIDPDTNLAWQIFVNSALVPARQADGSAWDPFNGEPDCFTTVTSGPGDGDSTRILDDTHMPVWNQLLPTVYLGSVLMQHGVHFAFTDGDVGSDDAMGSCTFTPTDVAAALRDADRFVTCSAGEIHVQFRFVRMP